MNDTLPTDQPTRLESSVAGLSFFADELGSGDPVVVVHHSTGPLWSPFLDQLAQDYHVIAPHLPGYGRSERPVAARSPRDEAVLCLQWLEQQELRDVHLIGLGLGGWIAAEMATMAQHRFPTLTLVGAAGVKPERGMIFDPMLTSFDDYVRKGFADTSRFVEMFGKDVPSDIAELWDYSREMTVRLTWKPWMWSTSLPLLIRGVRIPVLVVWGADDQIVPLECGEQYAGSFTDAQLVVIPDTGHNVDLEQPAALIAAVTPFLAAKGA
jgi:pimeloyl-ACP methyl ester carboxylesterase